MRSLFPLGTKGVRAGVLHSTIVAFFLMIECGNAEAQSEVQLQRLQQQLSDMQERFDRALREQAEEIKRLHAELEAASLKEAPVSKPAQEISVARSGSSYMNISFGSTMDAGYSTEPQPADQLELGDHDPQKRGFSLRNAEIALDGAVDPFFKGFANIVLKLDENDETEIELEESYLQTTSLPADLQVKAGQFFANFGRQNVQHPHQWAFVDQPLVLNRAFGPDGLRNIGTQGSWLMPTPFYSEIFLGVLDSQGGTAANFRNEGEENDAGVSTLHGHPTNIRELRGLGDLLYVPRYAASFDVTDTQTLLTGVSAALGPNSTGSGSDTQIYGADLYWKWKPENATAGFPFVAFQTEGLYSNFEAGEDLESPLPVSEEKLHDYGFYSQIVYGITSGWVAGLRADYVNGNNGQFDELDATRGERFRLSPVLTFYPSEFSKLRLQYNYDEGEFVPDASSLWMQLEFQLGSHAAHKF